MAKKIVYHISDLLDMVHFTIIKKKGENNIILDELDSIDKKIKSGELKNYVVNETTYFRAIINKFVEAKEYI